MGWPAAAARPLDDEIKFTSPSAYASNRRRPGPRAVPTTLAAIERSGGLSVRLSVRSVTSWVVAAGGPDHRLLDARSVRAPAAAAAAGQTAFN